MHTLHSHTQDVGSLGRSPVLILGMVYYTMYTKCLGAWQGTSNQKNFSHFGQGTWAKMERQFGRFPKEENKFSKTKSFLKTGCTTNNKLIATTITNHNKQKNQVDAVWGRLLRSAVYCRTISRTNLLESNGRGLGAAAEVYWLQYYFSHKSITIRIK